MDARRPTLREVADELNRRDQPGESLAVQAGRFLVNLAAGLVVDYVRQFYFLARTTFILLVGLLAMPELFELMEGKGRLTQYVAPLLFALGMLGFVLEPYGRALRQLLEKARAWYEARRQ